MEGLYEEGVMADKKGLMEMGAVGSAGGDSEVVGYVWMQEKEHRVSACQVTGGCLYGPPHNIKSFKLIELISVESWRSTSRFSKLFTPSSIWGNGRSCDHGKRADMFLWTQGNTKSRDHVSRHYPY